MKDPAAEIKYPSKKSSGIINFITKSIQQSSWATAGKATLYSVKACVFKKEVKQT